MIKNILIVEDNKAALEMLRQIVEEIQMEINIYTALNSMEAYQKALQYTIDVFVIDIVLDSKQSGDVSGIEFAQKVRGIEKYQFTPMIFTTALMDPKLYAFTSIHSYAYLEKPYDSNKIKRIIERALEYTTEREKDRNLFFRRDGLLFAINISEIIYIENSAHSLTIQTTFEKLKMPYKSCKKLMEEIDCKDFIQCSRSTIVNMKYVQALDSVNRYFILKEDFMNLEIGTAYIKKVKEYFQVKE